MACQSDAATCMITTRAVPSTTASHVTNAHTISHQSRITRQHVHVLTCHIRVITQHNMHHLTYSSKNRHTNTSTLMLLPLFHVVGSLTMGGADVRKHRAVSVSDTCDVGVDVDVGVAVGIVFCCDSMMRVTCVTSMMGSTGGFTICIICIIHTTHPHASHEHVSGHTTSQGISHVRAIHTRYSSYACNVAIHTQCSSYACHTYTM